jgi:hypothetical protein
MGGDDEQRRRREQFAERFWMYVDPEDVALFDAMLDRSRRLRWRLESPSLAAAIALIVWGLSKGDHGLWLAGPAYMLLITSMSVAAVLAVAGGPEATGPGAHMDSATYALALTPLCLFVVELSSALIARAPLPSERDGLAYALMAQRSEVPTRNYHGLIPTSMLVLSLALSRQNAFALSMLVLLLCIAAIVLQAVPRWSHLYFRHHLWPGLGRDETVVTSARSLPA